MGLDDLQRSPSGVWDLTWVGLGPLSVWSFIKFFHKVGSTRVFSIKKGQAPVCKVPSSLGLCHVFYCSLDQSKLHGQTLIPGEVDSIS